VTLVFTAEHESTTEKSAVEILPNGAQIPRGPEVLSDQMDTKDMDFLAPPKASVRAIRSLHSYLCTDQTPSPNPCGQSDFHWRKPSSLCAIEHHFKAMEQVQKAAIFDM